jgi:hypothetical protein
VTRDEARQLLALVASFDGRRSFGTYDVEAWLSVLGDVGWDEAHAAVLAHYATRTDCVMPAHVRRHAAATSGRLAPDDDEAFRLAAAVASAEGEGRGQLHPAVRDAYDTVGGSYGFAVPASTVRAQFRDAYRSARERHDERVLLGRLDVIALESSS